MNQKNSPFAVLAMDLDGTLTNHKKEVTERTKHAVRKAAEQGIFPVLASGRPLPGGWYVAEELGLPVTGGYILAFNGGQILDCRTREILYSKEVEAEYLPELFRIAAQFGVTALTYEGDVVLTEQAEDPYVKMECFINRMEARQVDSLIDCVRHAVPKCMMVGEHERLLPVRDYLNERFAGRLSIYFSEPFFLEIMAAGVDKAAGLAELAARLGTDRKRILAFGDGMNDISMLKYAGYSLAMGNGCEEAKQAADAVAPSNEEDGLAQALEQILIKEEHRKPSCRNPESDQDTKDRIRNTG